MKKALFLIIAACLLCACLGSAALADTQDVYEELDEIFDTIAGLDGEPSAEQTALIIAQLEGLDFSTAEESGGLTGSMVSQSGMSVQQLFAKLQQELAQSAKESAQSSIEQVQALQELSRTCTEYINEAKTIRSGLVEAGDAAAVPEDMLAFLQEHSLYVPTDPGKADSESWKAIVSALESFLESTSTNCQQQMVFVQDYIGQYNSFSQSYQSSTSEVQELLNGLSGSATMLGGGGAGMTVTALILGLVLGAAAAALVLKGKKKA